MFDSFKKSGGAGSGSAGKRKWISHGLFFIFLIGIVSLGMSLAQPKVVFAEDTPPGVGAVAKTAAEQAKALCPTTGPQPATCPATGISGFISTVWEGIVGPATQMIAVKALVDFVSFASNRIAYEAAVYVANGGPGEGSMFYKKGPTEAFKGFGKEMAGQAFADLSDITKKSFGLDLCAPPSGLEGSLLRLNLQLSIKQNYKPPAPRCDFDSVSKNWQQVAADASSLFDNNPFDRDQFLYKKLQEGLAPGTNELGATIGILNFTNEQAQKKAEKEFATYIGSIPLGKLKDVKNLVTGQTETPASIVNTQFEDQLKAAKGDENKIKPGDVLANPKVWYGLLNMTVSTFTNTLTSQLFNRVYKGLFSAKPDTETDPFNTELAGNTGTLTASKADLGNVFTATIVPNPQYNVLEEFAQCPPDGLQNRGLNQCVMDASVIAAIARGNLTVKEAIDQKVLNGAWPLISSQNTANTDRLCYTYGFCYGNLVKMRKARLIPIGWEMAANSPENNPTNPITLSQVMNAFNDCPGTWCHLIDPNWVLKAPESQCRASANGEIRLGSQAAGRQSTCVDAPTCIGEDNSGKCSKGFGYCVEEKNIWRVRGDECPAQFATCLTLKNTAGGKEASYLLNTVDNSNCTKQNAGCAWFKTQKHLDNKGLKNGVNDPKDDTYEWLPKGDDYNVENRSDDVRYSGSSLPTPKYGGGTSNTAEYSTYSYEDRLYLTHNAKQCAQTQAGCTELNVKSSNLVLNLVQNGSFEKDDDQNGIPDGWSQASGMVIDKTVSAIDGSNSLKIPGTDTLQYVLITPGSFYTFSVYVSATEASKSFNYALVASSADGTTLGFGGLTFSGDCEITNPGSTSYLSNKTSTNTIADANSWQRSVCTFTAPKGASQVKVQLGDPSSGKIRFDAVQLESGEIASNFTAGYSDPSPTKTYLKLAPAYLGCKGLDSDPANCSQYAQVCSAVDVGCNMYTPKDTGPNIPAIASAIDACPLECVGYDTYRQEGTLYEPAKFPTYMIADKATSCPAQAVGCDGFTQLGAKGGETQEYYTALRACLTPDMASVSPNVAATYFTWEGSDRSGYQLQTWQLLKSNTKELSPLTFTGSQFKETSPALAPCTKFSTTSNDTETCNDDAVGHMDAIKADSTCESHNDIFTNPDCREFFDKDGNIHYRKYSQTISIDAACTPYRKDVSLETDCTKTGGYWNPQGFCRYFALPKESSACTADQNGCRMFTGGAGRNATTILDETFESGTYSNFRPAKIQFAIPSTVLSISNDSVSNGGHSLHVSDSNSALTPIMATIQGFLDDDHHDKKYDDTSAATKAATCSSIGAGTRTITPAGCKLAACPAVAGQYSCGCTVAPGKSSCGTLTDSLVKGKTYTLQFWAKGTGDLHVAFLDLASASGTTHDFVKPSNTVGVNLLNLTPLSLKNSWNVYSIGPIDTSGSEYIDFGPNSVLGFVMDAGKTFNIDNITLTQTEENITRIKDSWVTPATCDQTPDGTASPQYYLGCKAYTDRKGVDGNYYQFTHICSEKAVGCSAYYNTFNSDSAYGQVSNARCVNLQNGGTMPNGAAVTTTTSCIVNSATYCTIPVGQNYCVFSTPQAFADPLPIDPGGKFGIAYGPEAVVTPQDQSAYLVDNGSATCTADFKGCREVGVPTFAQDQKTVKSFASKYVIDNPQDYSNILCENKALFCEEFSTSQDGNFYFKDPLDKTCEYKIAVAINGKNYDGWFRSGKSEPCYWTDGNANGKYEPGTSDTAYLVSGDQSQIWENGDNAYDGWVGACDAASNRCTELIDKTDTSLENHGKGKSYYVVNNAKLSEDAVSTTEKCGGLVGQKGGCALFDNTTNSQKKFNASASYVLSQHADLLLKKHQNDLVDPISCAQQGGKFDVSADTAKKIGLSSGNSVDLCRSRCFYNLEAGDELLTPSAKQLVAKTQYLERSCMMASDCPVLKTRLGKDTTASSCDFNTGVPLNDDANTVLKVNRDRTCASWLACNSSRSAWDAGSQKYINICDSIGLCNQAGTQSEQASCESPTSRPALVMTKQLYSSRDVSWAGSDYSGYEIPGQMPLERLSQFNLNPKKLCVFKPGVPVTNVPSIVCSTDKNCDDSVDPNYGVGKAECKTIPPDFRLVYNAGICNSTGAVNSTLPKVAKEGDSCQLGACKSNGNACSATVDCGKDGNNAIPCIFGYCKDLTTADCTSNADCTAVGSTHVCDMTEYKCENTAKTDSETLSCVNKKFVLAATTITGSCFQDRCITDIRSTTGSTSPDPLIPNTSDDSQSCRGYPEIDSPYPQKVVTEWINPSTNNNASTSVVPGQDVKLTSEQFAPAKYVPGFEGSAVCSPVCYPDGKNCVADDSCLCSYTKAIYAKGSVTRYYSKDTQATEFPSGFCTGGKHEGLHCSDDTTCNDGDKSNPGTCQRLSSTNTMYGWQGYCLEKDSTIQINGSTDAKDRACLTWLPVDQLSGATDLYGKDMTAGYPLKNTYYCGQVETTWDLQTTGTACAENTISANACDDEDPVDNDGDLKSAATSDAAYTGVYCPPAYFAVMVGCGDANKGKLCTQGSGDDYPYFCVPKSSHRTDKTECVPPGSLKTFTSKFNTTIYLENLAGWDAAKTSFATCTVKGVLQSDIKNYIGKTYEANPLSIPDHLIRNQSAADIAWNLAKDSAGVFIPGYGLTSVVDLAADTFMSFFGDYYYYYNFSPNLKLYPTCKNVIEVSKSVSTGDVNAAWTDRLWNNDQDAYALSPPDPLMSYTHKTPSEFYGSSIDPLTKNDDFDVVPVNVAACKVGESSVLLPLSNTCAVGAQATPNEARSLDKFSVNVAPKCNGLGKVKACTPQIIDLTKKYSCTDGVKLLLPSACEKNGGYCDKKDNCVAADKNDSCNDLHPALSTFLGFFVTTCEEHGGKCAFSPGGTCDSGGAACQADSECPALTAGNGGFNIENAKNRLKQIFAESYGTQTFKTITKENPNGIYDPLATPGDVWWDTRATANGAKPPIITSVGSCVGTNCFEKNDGKFSVNGQDTGDIQGVGSKHMNVSFFAHADKNQMALRKVIVDWGDSETGLLGGNTQSWPIDTNRWSGSYANDNFYKNHRGMDASHPSKNFCDSTLKDKSDPDNKLGFGGAPEACTQSYILFNHDYVCTPGDIASTLKGRTCVPDEKDPKRLKNSPCIETVDEVQYCVFQPRVHAVDNWGWCTGFCNVNPQSVEDTTSCFDASSMSDKGGVNECDINQCPGGSKCNDSTTKTDNPWINYDGVIRIKPIQ